MRRPSLVGVSVSALLLITATIALAPPQHAVAQGAPPFDLTDHAVIDEGAKIFSQTCTGYCHGKGGGPSRAPKLRGHKLEQEYVYARISKGSPNGMPAFEGALPKDTIWKLVAYVLSLSDAKDK